MEWLIVDRHALCYNSATPQAKVAYCYFHANKKNRHKQKDKRLKVPETKHTMEITDEQYCVYIMLSCGSMDNITILNVPGRTTRAPFTRQRLGLPHELAHCIIPGWSQLFNVALLSLMSRVWVYVVLPSSRMTSSSPLVDRPDQLTWEAECVGLMGREEGRREYWVTLYLSHL